MKKKALSLLMAAVMLATTPAIVSLASDTATTGALVVSEAESETSAEESADAKSAEVNEGDTALESVGTDEEPGVSVEETESEELTATGETPVESEEMTEAGATEADAAEAAMENVAETETAANAGTEAQTDAAMNADTETASDAEEETAAEDGASASSLEAVVTDEEPYVSLDYDNMVTDYTVRAGTAETATFETLVSSSAGTLSYQWYDSDGDVIAGATGSTYTISLPTSEYYTQYKCVVTASTSEDSTSETVWFYLSVTNELVVDYNYYHSVTPGGSTTLSVSADSLYSAVSYHWYVWDSANDCYSEIAGETTSTLTLTNITSSGSYQCVVRDEVSSATAYFYVRLNSGLEVTYADGSYKNSIMPGESAVLAVSATTNYGSLSYQWYQYQENSGYYPISGAVTSTYTTGTEGYYYCLVSDAYNSYSIDFYVNVETGLTVSTDTEDTVRIAPGESAVLAVSATTNYGSLSYQWYRYQNNTGYVAVSGATSSSLTVSAGGDYYCRVSDGYSSNTQYFYVVVESGLSVKYNETAYIVEGGAAVMTVYASVDYGSLSYEWYYYDSNDSRVVLAETGSTLTIGSAEAGDEYFCLVSDDYGNSNVAYFRVKIATVLSVSYCSYYEVAPNQSTTLSVHAVSPDGEVTYQWYIWDNDKDDYVAIAGATAAACTVSPVSTYTDYQCRVSDGTTTKDVYMEVKIDTGFSVSADSRGKLILTGESVAFSVSATAKYGTLTYSWYCYDDEGRYTELGNTAALALSGLTTSRYYYCSVSNGYESSTISFRVVVVSAIGETAESISEAKTMTAGTSQTATIATGGTYMYYKIVPTESGTYTFYTLDEEDTYGYFYNATGDELESDDDGGENANFKITYTLTAGVTYYLGVRYYDSDNVGSFVVYMTAGESICSHTNTTHTAAKAATCTTSGNIEYWTCTDCGARFSDAALTTAVSDVTIAATKHASAVHTAAKAATCAATGNIEYWYCPDCGKYFSNSALTVAVSSSSLTTAKLSTHTYGAWTTTTAATALATGTQTRTCSVCGYTETQTIAKLTPTITVNASSIKLKKKQSTTALKVSGLATGDSVASWKSSNTKIVTVTSKGKITAKNKTGTAYITITLKSGLTKRIKVTVQKSAVKTTKITVASKSVSIKKGKTYTIKPVISPITSVQKVTYSSSNKKVATVNAKGKITAKKKGTATITVKSGSKSVKIKVTVK